MLQLESEPEPHEFEIKPREHEELEEYLRPKPVPPQALTAEEEQKTGYVRAVKTREEEELEEKVLIIPKAKVRMNFRTPFAITLISSVNCFFSYCK